MSGATPPPPPSLPSHEPLSLPRSFPQELSLRAPPSADAISRLTAILFSDDDAPPTGPPPLPSAAAPQHSVGLGTVYTRIAEGTL